MRVGVFTFIAICGRKNRPAFLPLVGFDVNDRCLIYSKLIIHGSILCLFAVDRAQKTLHNL